MRRHIYDAYGGVVKSVFTEGKTIIQHIWQDLEPILERNKKLQNPNLYGKAKPLVGGNFIGSVPTVILYEELKRQGINPGAFCQWPTKAQNAWMKKNLLGNPDFKFLRAS